MALREIRQRTTTRGEVPAELDFELIPDLVIGLELLPRLPRPSPRQAALIASANLHGGNAPDRKSTVSAITPARK